MPHALENFGKPTGEAQAGISLILRIAPCRDSSSSWLQKEGQVRNFWAERLVRAERLQLELPTRDALSNCASRSLMLWWALGKPGILHSMEQLDGWPMQAQIRF